ncbi:MAG TPA: C2 family cysteine protease [Bryobacteraceae bacterium]|nr:C2 family cysteine protease [Bryobacteraceae bacterium]
MATSALIPVVSPRLPSTLATHNENGLLAIPKTAPDTTPTPSGFGLTLRRRGALFPHPPTIADIKQWGLGDCFLLSASIAVLSMPGGSQVIEEMMKDDGRGHVYVRLYDKSLAPQILKMRKQVRISYHHAYGSLWVQMLEASYGAMYSKGSYEVLHEGGQSAIALTAILGATADSLQVTKSTTEGDQKVLSLLMNVCNLDNPKYLALVKKDVFGDNDILYKKWITYFNVAAHRRWKEHLGKQVGVQQWKMERFTSFLDSEEKAGNLNKELKAFVLEWVTSRKTLSGKRGSGIYTQHQLNTYSAIEDALRFNKPVTAHTVTQIPTAAEGRGGSAGEPMRKGLVGKHVYAVLGCQTTEDVRFILVRNPWGEDNPFGSTYGRGYVSRTKPDGSVVLSPKSIKKTEFWLELNDFDKWFYNVVGGEVPMAETRARSATIYSDEA